MPTSDIVTAPVGTPSSQAAPRLRIHVICGAIQDAGQQAPLPDSPPIDAIAVGHYAKVEPQFAELALDKALSGSLPPLSVEAGAASPTLGIVTDFTTRNIIQGELGVPFFLPDPRDKNRIAVIAGMGLVGQFGAPELAILVEQLFWALARLGRRHLATVLIGSGTGNIETETAVGRWMDGAARAIVNGQHLPSLTDLTFVELAPAKAENIRSALLDYTTGLNRLGLSISVTPSEPIPVPEGTIPPTSSRNQITTHICGEQRGKKYLFGAMSDEASYHQDQNEFDPDTISRANDDLAAKETPDHQRQAGEYLFKLLVPKSQSEAFARKDPIVIQCDHEIAHLHWEMMVVPGLPRNSIGDGSEFLGIYPGIARQLRTNFDVPPEPPPTYERTLRILIVADTDESRPVPPSQNEAQTIEALFNTLRDRLGSSGSKQQVFVESLIGPDLASYDNVLERLLRYPTYDILHFSGHCEYDDDDPPKSGWLFSKGKQITAYELSRVERLPGFVFSNACYSGEIPTRTGRRSIPSFAELFFQKGVKNFVCTAWPVVSEPACNFASRFYKELLGSADRSGGYMFEAMREARKSIWNSCPSGRRTWGAYQHYGNPWFKLS